ILTISLELMTSSAIIEADAEDEPEPDPLLDIVQDAKPTHIKDTYMKSIATKILGFLDIC
ncbi:MAG: hypothetical protein PUH11_08285, partial [Bacilli bacterium]|nr:hypothetical protein [Bacilli bacterium]